MDKFKVNPGTALNLSNVIDTIQNYISNNITKRFLKLFKVKGILSEQTNPTNLAPILLNPITINISAGTVILENGEVITLTNTVQVTPLSLYPTLAQTSYVLLIKYVAQGSEPVSVTNGFYYDQTGNDEYTTRYSKYLDSYSFQVIPYIDYVKNIDEFPLCKFTTNEYNDEIDDIIGLEDLRVITKLDKNLYDPTDLVLKDRDSTGVNKINGKLESNEFISPSIKILGNVDSLNIKYNEIDDVYDIALDSNNKPVRVLDSSGASVLSVAPQIDTFDSFGNAVIRNVVTITGNVQVNNGTIKVNNQSVSLASDDVLPVINPRIVEVFGLGEHNKTEFGIKLKWGYDDLIGMGSIDGYFTITNVGFQEDITSRAESYINYYLWLPTKGKNYKIVDQSITTINGVVINGTRSVIKLRVIDLETNQYPDLSDCTITNALTSEPAWIHSNADRYSIVAIPVINESIIKKDADVKHISAAFSPVLQIGVYNVKVDKKYKFSVIAHSGTKTVAPVYMTSGVYTKFNTEHKYSAVFLARYPSINSMDAVVSLTRVGNGYNVQIEGWDDADYFEACFAQTGIAAFSNNNLPKFTFSTRTYPIPFLNNVNGVIAVRPMIGGQQVATPIPINVETHIAGMDNINNTTPNFPLISQAVDLTTYTGNITGVIPGSGSGNVNKYEITMGDIYTPYTGNFTYATQITTSFPSTSNGDIIVTANNVELMINSVVYSGTSGTFIFYTTKVNQYAAEPLSGACKIATGSIRSRLLYRLSSNTEDFFITKVTFDMDGIYTPSNVTDKKIILRIYQEGRESKASYLELQDTPDGLFSIDLNMKVFGILGKDTILIVDAYSNTDPNFTSINTYGLRGNLVVYGNRMSHVRSYTVDKYAHSEV